MIVLTLPLFAALAAALPALPDVLLSKLIGIVAVPVAGILVSVCFRVVKSLVPMLDRLPATAQQAILTTVHAVLAALCVVAGLTPFDSLSQVDAAALQTLIAQLITVGYHASKKQKETRSILDDWAADPSNPFTIPDRSSDGPRR